MLRVIRKCKTMSVGKVNLGSVSTPADVTKASVKPNAKVSFSGVGSTDKALAKEISTHMPKAINWIGKFSKLTGEVPNIIINAIGTGLVAPIFIKYNFLSKTDEDTRTYSAMRQPISAVLSVAAQIGAVIPTDRLIVNMSNKGDFVGEVLSSPKYNQYAFQDINYIKRTLKKQNPKLSEQELDTLAAQKHNEKVDKIAKTVLDKNSVEYTSGGKEVKLQQDEVKKLLIQTTDDMIKNAKDNKTEKDFIEGIQKTIKEGKNISINDVAEKLSKGVSEFELNSFATNLVKKHISNVGANVKGLRQIAGLVVSVATIPISCSALNYLYPRIMDAVFPSLSKKKNKNSKDSKDSNDEFMKAIDNSIHRGAIASNEEVRR